MRGSGLSSKKFGFDFFKTLSIQYLRFHEKLELMAHSVVSCMALAFLAEVKGASQKL